MISTCSCANQCAAASQEAQSCTGVEPGDGGPHRRRARPSSTRGAGGRRGRRNPSIVRKHRTSLRATRCRFLYGGVVEGAPASVALDRCVGTSTRKHSFADAAQRSRPCAALSAYQRRASGAVLKADRLSGGVVRFSDVEGQPDSTQMPRMRPFVGCKRLSATHRASESALRQRVLGGSSRRTRQTRRRAVVGAVRGPSSRCAVDKAW